MRANHMTAPGTLLGVFLFAALSVFPSATNAANANPDILADPLANGGFETAAFGGATKAYDWQNFQSGYVRSGDAHGGSWSIELHSSDSGTFAGAYQRIDLNQKKLKPVLISGFVKGKNIAMRSGGWFGATLYIEAHMKGGSVAYWNSVANTGTFGWRRIGFNTGTISAINRPIDYIFVVPALGQSTGTAWFDDISVEQYTPAQPLVTLMFDDGYASDYKIAKNLLRYYGFLGTSAIPLDNIDERNYMTAQQIEKLTVDGWEIVSHGITHEDFTKMNEAQIRNEFSKSKSVLEGWFGVPVRSFALPFGAYNANIMAIGSEYYDSVRAFETGSNPQGSFPNDIKVRGVLENTTARDVARWIAGAKASNTWLVIVFHEIAYSGDDAYHINPRTFKKIIRKVYMSGVRVVPYSEGLGMFSS